MAEDERELPSRIARGDREAFAELFRRRRPDVYRFALHISGSAEAADDVVQEVFLTVIHEAARYAPERAAVMPWLLGIARNHVKRRLHRDRRMVSLDDTDGAPAAALTIDADPVAGLEQERDVAAVRRALMAQAKISGGRGGAIARLSPGEFVEEKLAPRTIENVRAEGIRRTLTIPAGQIGNLLPIKVASEEWTSPDLKVLVLTQHSDPRIGESSYRLLNIIRAEPNPSFFQVPPDYTVRETGIRKMEPLNRP